MRTVLLNNKGLTLIEVLIALVITLVLFLALMQTALLSISTNTMNSLRDEAVRVAEMRANEARNLAFTDDVDTLLDDTTDASLTAAICPADFVAAFGTTGLRITRSLRNISSFDFCTNRDVTLRGDDNKEVVITVGWLWKAVPYTHSISTIVRRQ